jgi:hypothetical protein
LTARIGRWIRAQSLFRLVAPGHDYVPLVMVPGSEYGVHIHQTDVQTWMGPV